MADLTELQYERIVNTLAEGALRNPSLVPELADHIACIIENEFGHEPNFEKALTAAFNIVCPEGPIEIDQQITQILNPKNYIIMKKAFYSALFAALFLLSNGLMFKFFHWPGATIILFSGFFMLGCISAPLLAAVLLRNFHLLGRQEKIQQASAVFASVFIAAGGIFKTMHWPGANITFMFGMILLNMIFIPLFFYRSYLKATV